MIWGLCESPITFEAIIGWSNALNEGRMQSREIMDLEAMLSKGPTAEQLNEAEAGGENSEGEISEKVAGPSIKEEEEVADEPEADANEDDEDMVERRAKPQAAEDDDEDNTLSLAQMEETLKPSALEKFAQITSIYKKFSKIQGSRMDAFQSGQEFPSGEEKKYQKLREQLTAEVESVQFHGSKIEYLVEALYAYNKRLMGLGGQMLPLQSGIAFRARRSSTPTPATSSTRAGLPTFPSSIKKWAAFAAAEGDTVERIRFDIAAIAQSTGTSLGEFGRNRQYGPEGRARSSHRQEGNGRGEPPPRHLHRQEIHQPRPSVPRPHSRGKHRPNEGGR